MLVTKLIESYEEGVGIIGPRIIAQIRWTKSIPFLVKSL